jgi:hypothetical protein
MNHDEQQEPDREPPMYVADAAGRSWLEALQAARLGTERKREADAQLREAWGVEREG